MLTDETGAPYTQRMHHISCLLTKLEWYLSKVFTIKYAYWRNWSSVYPKDSPYIMLIEKNRSAVYPKDSPYDMLTDKIGAVFIQGIHHKARLLTKLERCLPKVCTMQHTNWQNFSDVTLKASRFNMPILRTLKILQSNSEFGGVLKQNNPACAKSVRVFIMLKLDTIR